MFEHLSSLRAHHHSNFIIIPIVVIILNVRICGEASGGYRNAVVVAGHLYQGYLRL